MLVVTILVAAPQVLPAQAVRWTAPSAGQAGSLAAAGLVFLAPHILDLNVSPPGCAPCSEADVPGFDRWVIGPERDAWSAASTAAVVGLAAVTWWDSGVRQHDLRRVAVSLEAASWAAAAAELLKAATNRNRPVLYTAAAPDAARSLDSQRSFPSGHSAAAFALATSYWLQHDPPLALELGVLGAATGVAVLRVLARRHFPSDVAAGAALGVGMAVVVHEIRF